jgi:hypothetical protein
LERKLQDLLWQPELNGHHKKHGSALQFSEFTTQYHLRAHTHEFTDTNNEGTWNITDITDITGIKAIVDTFGHSIKAVMDIVGRYQIVSAPQH